MDLHAAIGHSGARSSAARKPTTADFVLEDDGLMGFYSDLVSGSWCASNQRQQGSPVIAVSAGFELSTGYTAAEVAGMPCCKALQTDPEAEAEVEAALANQTASVLELTQHHKGGRSLPVKVCFVPVCDSSGSPWYSIQFAVSTEQRNKTASQPQQAEQAVGSKWIEQVQQCAGALCLTTAQDKSEVVITNCSRQLCAITGYNPSELCNSSLTTLLGPETSNSSTRQLLSAQLAGQPATLKLLLYRKDGTPFWGLVASCPLAAQQAVASSGAAAVRPPQQHVTLVVNVTASKLRRIGKYVLGRMLGQGASGVVRIGKHVSTDEVVAIKAVDATRFCSITEIEQVQEEMAVLATLKHPNIIRLLEVHFVSSCFYFVMEYASGGSMVRYSHNQDGGKLSERQARQLFGQIFSALEYCHKRRVIHRDLKPENILMDGDTPKIADFGLAGMTSTFSGSGFTQQCGTPEFSAPEIVEGREYQGPAIDLWSVGVMLYEALTGHLPFKGSSQSALFKSIQRGVYQPLPQGISSEARDLVSRLLTVDPAARIGWSELVRHPWLSNANKSSPGAYSSVGQQFDSLNITSAGSSGRQRHSSAAGDTALAEGGSSSQEFGSESGRSSIDSDSAFGKQSSTGASKLRGTSQAELAVADADGESGSGVEVTGLQQRASSFTTCHDSVRVFIPDSSRDDPITAAIKQRLSAAAAVCGDSRSVCSDSSSGQCSPSGRAYSFSCVASPGALGARRLAQTSKSGGSSDRLNDFNTSLSGGSRQACSGRSFPSLSPAANDNASSGGSPVRSPNSIISSDSTSGAGRGRGALSVAKERKPSVLGSSCGSGEGSLPPIKHKRSTSKHRIRTAL